MPFWDLAWAFQPMRRRSYLHRALVGILDRVARAAFAASDAKLVHLSSVAVYSPRRSAAVVHRTGRVTGSPDRRRASSRSRPSGSSSQPRGPRRRGTR
jgi:hypothetical protein